MELIMPQLYNSLFVKTTQKLPQVSLKETRSQFRDTDKGKENYDAPAMGRGRPKGPSRTRPPTFPPRPTSSAASHRAGRWMGGWWDG